MQNVTSVLVDQPNAESTSECTDINLVEKKKVVDFWVFDDLLLSRLLLTVIRQVHSPKRLLHERNYCATGMEHDVLVQQETGEGEQGPELKLEDGGEGKVGVDQACEDRVDDHNNNNDIPVLLLLLRREVQAVGPNEDRPYHG